MKFIVVGYYTPDTFYEAHARLFANSMKRFDIPYYLEAVPDQGGWILNCGYKPTFILKMMKKFSECNIVYVDCDAEFGQYPVLFEELECNIAIHHFDRRNHPGIKRECYEVLSGTIFLKNVTAVYKLVEKWEAECKRRPGIWDQKALEKVLDGDFYNLPPEYCVICNIMRHIKKPIIVHYQASRIVRENKMNIYKCSMSRDVVAGSFPRLLPALNSSTRPDSL